MTDDDADRFDAERVALDAAGRSDWRLVAGGLLLNYGTAGAILAAGCRDDIPAWLYWGLLLWPAVSLVGLSLAVRAELRTTPATSGPATSSFSSSASSSPCRSSSSCCGASTSATPHLEDDVAAESPLAV
jgi:hypothetical protein